VLFPSRYELFPIPQKALHQMKVILQSIILNKSSIKINVLFPIPHSLFPIPQKALHQMKVILARFTIRTDQIMIVQVSQQT
jgi:hypothetical protein